MAAEHEVLVNSIDEQVNKILSEGGDEIALLTSFADRMNNDVWKVMRETTKGELDLYCQKYKGFYYLMKLLEKLALGISEGKIPVPR